ncbi:serine carboxypeptidase S28-domain-containing protein [Aspergillus pseudoustus]|uniref:Serine carboxypeptidase S28-domain-containing protein n=1 Tax=Aspergillus pseudoustus TaxID=1810923 RepID=A0ABR4IAQ1_9EURO
MRLSHLSLGLLPALLPQALATTTYKTHNFSAPIDHFHNETRYEPHSNSSFNLRYWFDPQYYKPGGPVIVIAAGETDGTDRFPFLSQGIVTQLAKAYNGLGVILEHRYYGESFPFADLTLKNIRFLSTEQSLADYAYFAQHAVFPGLEEHDLTASATPWIAYGGSYAGAQVAFLRKVYPEIFWGAVSSSGVTAAIIDYWAYFEPIRNFGPAQCIDAIQTRVDFVDRILIDHAENETLHAQLQAAFGFSTPINNTDFVNFLSNPLGAFQSRNWDPAVGSYEFRHYCDNITAAEPLYTPTNYTALLPGLLESAGYDKRNKTLLANLRNEIGYLNSSVQSYLEEQAAAQVSDVATSGSLSKDSGTSWNYQVCTEWGYFMPGSTVPEDIRPLLSRLITLEYTSNVCPETFNIDTAPDVSQVNKHGGLDFSYPRVAIIGGVADPWRDATPHAEGLPGRESSDSEPFILLDIPAEDVWDGIRGGVHHWDQNGLSEEEVAQGERPPWLVEELQEEIVRFVGGWLGEWDQTGGGVADL